MSQPSFHQGDHHFLGNVTFGGNCVLPPGSVVDAAVPAGAGLSGLKLQQQRLFVGGQNGTVADAKLLIGSARGAGQALSFRCQLEELANDGAATVSIDLKKNGVTMLTAPVVIDTDAAGEWVAGTFTGSTTHVAGDRYRIEIDGTAGGGTLGKGLSWELAVLDSPL